MVERFYNLRKTSARTQHATKPTCPSYPVQGARKRSERNTRAKSMKNIAIALFILFCIIERF